jgi:hypothetical protein
MLGDVNYLTTLFQLQRLYNVEWSMKKIMNDEYRTVIACITIISQSPFGDTGKRRTQYTGRDSNLVPPQKKFPRRVLIFWDITLCSPLKINRRFGRIYCLPPVFTLVYCSAYSSTLKMEATCSSRTSADFRQTTQRYVPEDTIFHNHLCENFKSYRRTLHHAVSHEMVLCALSLAGPKRR